MSPIHVKDVAKCFVDSLKNDESCFKTYTLGGEQDYNWRQIIKIISSAYGKNKLAIIEISNNYKLKDSRANSLRGNLHM